MLARKISFGKWRAKPYLAADAIRADAVTGCLRTRDDTLSFWSCEDTPDDLDQVFLALATGSSVSRFETMDIVLIAEADLDDAGVVTEANEGDTAVEDLKARHIDLVYLDLDKLAALARIIAARVRVLHARRTAGQLRRLVEDAVVVGRLRPELLNPELGDRLRARGTPD
ncbi:MAG: hypothetical protein C4547_03955 [Phycisphaerales bacterium]|nr:MAG: hypothetical protein C4547_03955 [Phycisphaerales bacterium]